MRKYLLALVCSVGLAIAAPAAAWANQTPGTPTQTPTTGQHGSNLGPNNSCGAPGTSTPGNSANANGSPVQPQRYKVLRGEPGQQLAPRERHRSRRPVRRRLLLALIAPGRRSVVSAVARPHR
jgi:hypothetical protein